MSSDWFDTIDKDQLIIMQTNNNMNFDGHVFGMLVIVMAAAEAAVALAIIINIYNNMNTINVDQASQLKQ